jgi:hypothetical protein
LELTPLHFSNAERRLSIIKKVPKLHHDRFILIGFIFRDRDSF